MSARTREEAPGERCASCRFFKPSLVHGARGLREGECRATAPTPIYVGAPVRPGVWPTVTEADWCGSYQARGSFPDRGVPVSTK